MSKRLNKDLKQMITKSYMENITKDRREEIEKAIKDFNLKFYRLFVSEKQEKEMMKFKEFMNMCYNGFYRVSWSFYRDSSKVIDFRYGFPDSKSRPITEKMRFCEFSQRISDFDLVEGVTVPKKTQDSINKELFQLNQQVEKFISDYRDQNKHVFAFVDSFATPKTLFEAWPELRNKLSEYVMNKLNEEIVPRHQQVAMTLSKIKQNEQCINTTGGC